MSGFSAKANELLVEIYRNVQILEQNELKKQRLNISINEMHMIELIAKGKTGMTVSEIAQQLKVTKPSVTVAVNKLVQKGYCEKQRLPGDGRAVQVMLTPEGKKVEAFHRRCRFTDISFSLNRGEILGVAGLMGAGRTEIMRAIFGLDPLTAGTITMNGKVLRIRSSRDALDQGIGYVSEDRRSVGLVLGMTVRDNITMSNLSQYCRHSWIRHKEEKRVADEQIREFSIKTPSAEQIAANLSGGNQQKIVLSKTLLCQPEVIILDEPTRGIDVGAKAEIHKMISALASQGKGIIMISSEMPEILGMSDRIIVIHEGRKKGELLRENASQQAIMEMMLAQ